MSEHNALYDSIASVKKEYMKDISALNVEEFKQEAQKGKETVTLYHGTTTDKLKFIIQNGILPRKETGISTWKDDRSSIETVTYMTKKWHYFYAFNAWKVHLDTTYGDDWVMRGIVPQTGVFPCYFACKVPKGLLVADEDFIISNFMKKKILSYAKKNKDIVLDPMECLAEYGTVGVLGGVSPSMIDSFTVLGSAEMFKYVIDEDSPYRKECYNWQHGKGKGNIKLRQIWEKEAESDMNGTWWLSENKLRDDANISFAKNPSTGKLAMIQSKS